MRATLLVFKKSSTPADGTRMEIARRHHEEDRRLAAVRDLGLLDSEAEERFDRLTQLAATIVGVPIALVTLVDDERQWFKSRVGLDIAETPRDEAFCAHAIVADDGLFTIEDTWNDPRFADNPLVLGDPTIRFYAGQPLHSENGMPVGTLCVIDRRPRMLDAAQRQALVHLGELVEQEFARRSEQELLAQLATSERLLDATLDVAPVGLAIVAGDRTIIRCNSTFAEHAGRPADELVGVVIGSLVHPDEHREATEIGRRFLTADHRSATFDHRVSRPDGTSIWVNTNIAVIPDLDRPLAVTATFDVTERRQMTLALDRFSHLFHHANDLVVVMDARGRLLYASPSNERLLGYPLDRRHPKGVLGMVHPDDLDEVTRELTALIDGTRGTAPFVLRVVAASGAVHHLECVGVNLLDEPAVQGIVLTARDVTERIRLGDLLAHRAAHDPLTDLANRQLLESTLAGALARSSRDGSTIGLCFIDLDGFKQINDSAGHAAGDEVIVAVAESIRGSIRGGDLAARVGGDEFVIVLDPIADASQALTVASRVRRTLLARSACGASIGLALSESDDSVTSLMSRADAAMYRAKARRDSSIELDAPAAAGAMAARC